MLWPFFGAACCSSDAAVMPISSLTFRDYFTCGAVQQYVIEEIMNESLLTAMETYNLVGADGDGSEADINTDIEEMLKVLSTHDKELSILSHKTCRHPAWVSHA